jgi:hypothetical protein
MERADNNVEYNAFKNHEKIGSAALVFSSAALFSSSFKES